MGRMPWDVVNFIAMVFIVFYYYYYYFEDVLEENNWQIMTFPTTQKRPP